MEVLFYILGSITGIFAALYFITKKSSLNKDTIINALTETIKDLKEYKKTREGKKRFGRYISKNWYNSTEPNIKWDVVFELKEISCSVDDENLIKFEVINHFSENEKSTKDFKKWFYSSFGGGYIQTKNNPDFNWITNLSKSEERDEKLSNLGLD